MPDYREVTINIVEGEAVAYVWTNIPKYARRILKLGGQPQVKRGEGFLIAPVGLFWPRKRRVGRPGQAGKPFPGKRAVEKRISPEKEGS